jgi:heat shock protein HslJ
VDITSIYSVDMSNKSKDNPYTRAHRRKQPTRKYRQATPELIRQFELKKLEVGNGTQAIRELEPEHLTPYDRAHELTTKSKTADVLTFLDNEFSNISKKAIKRVSSLVDSENEGIATKNSHFVLEQVRGKAVQKTDNRNININIQSLLD